MATSPHLALPFIAPAQALKHITHNEAIAALDGLVQLAVLDRDLATPPTEPEAGDRYLIAADPTGAWAGHQGEIAQRRDDGWQFHVPAIGWLAFVLDEQRLLVLTGSGWQSVMGTAASFGVNAEADLTNRLAVKSDALLFSHDDVTPGTGDVRVTLNRLDSTATASLLFQSAWSGRAELGLCGDDKLHLKLSPDGTAWAEGLVADPATGHIGIGTATPAATLDIAGTLRLLPILLADLPSATLAGQLAFLTDETGGPVLAFSDGTDWRRTTDRAIVS